MYVESKCRASGFLHSFRIVGEYFDGVYEVCTRCFEGHFFHELTPNHVYLAFHERSLLQPDDPQYEYEYGKK